MKFLFNRIQAIKLAQMVLKYSKVQNAQIEYYLEELALQVRPGQIERAYLAEIVNFYVKQHQSASKILNKFALCK